MNLELPATGENTVDMSERRLVRRVCKWCFHEYAAYLGTIAYADATCRLCYHEQFSEIEPDPNPWWPLRSTAAGEGCNDAAGSEVAQVRKEAP